MICPKSRFNRKYPTWWWMMAIHGNPLHDVTQLEGKTEDNLIKMYVIDLLYGQMHQRVLWDALTKWLTGTTCIKSMMQSEFKARLLILSNSRNIVRGQSYLAINQIAEDDAMYIMDFNGESNIFITDGEITLTCNKSSNGYCIKLQETKQIRLRFLQRG